MKHYVIMQLGVKELMIPFRSVLTLNYVPYKKELEITLIDRTTYLLNGDEAKQFVSAYTEWLGGEDIQSQTQKTI